MFNGQRYLTRGVQQLVSIPLQITLWRIIETMKTEVDYLQIFEVEQLPDNQIKIIHKQEVPEYECMTITVGTMCTQQLKIFVIDDHEYSTMLLAEEY